MGDVRLNPIYKPDHDRQATNAIVAGLLHDDSHHAGAGLLVCQLRNECAQFVVQGDHTEGAGHLSAVQVSHYRFRQSGKSLLYMYMTVVLQKQPRLKPYLDRLGSQLN